ncbi:DUF1461 domain-containing protein [Desulfurivibrio sp. D14AmB]|uniref:lipoprotein intramolecular transacylase Lit n=1 Tax=Desulfurivibrio sp. D14AmB TaxID=3374370 RepID=UPI00376F255C
MFNGAEKRWHRLPGWALIACLLPAALLLSWLLLARLDFLYPFWYRVLEIEEHIALYAPQNRHGRADFVQTSPAEHRRLFALIVQGIHGRTELAAIEYRDQQGRALGQLLQADEIGHLRDVARLVKLLLGFGWVLLAGAVGLVLLLRLRRWSLPPPSKVVVATALLLGVGGLLLALVGPQRFFDLLHEWIFPPDHPWFFYYQDSLMTTLMKAPQIFAAIAATWVGLALLICGLALVGINRIIR